MPSQVVPDKKFCMRSLYKPLKTREPEAGHFWSYGHNFDKISRGLLGDATYQITRLHIDLMVSDNIFSCIPL